MLWAVAYDEAEDILRQALRPFLRHAFESTDERGRSGWDKADDRRRRRKKKGADGREIPDPLPPLTKDIQNWSTDFCVQQLMINYYDVFASNFPHLTPNQRDYSKEHSIRLGWLNELVLIRNKRSHRADRDPLTDTDIETFLFLTSALLRSARAPEDAAKVDLLRRSASESAGQAPRLATPIPDSLSLSTQGQNAQWADYRDYLIDTPRPWSLSCRMTTESPYFRFGFKLLPEEARVFGDASLQSYDANLIIHVGRNNWDRPGVAAQDLFLSAYMSGSSIGDDRCLFRCEPRVDVGISLTLERSYTAVLTINGQEVFRQVVPPNICRRVLVCAWGDREKFDVEVTKLYLRPAKRA